MEGLSAADERDLYRAAGHLDVARRIFLGVGNQAGVAAIELDRLQLDMRQGQEPTVSDAVCRPRVFLSSAGNDRATAERLRHDLWERDIETFIFPPGGNFVFDINRTLAQSDYFVLLWSQACVDRPWVDAEWSAALACGLQERRSFLFIVRLDTTPLPPLLAPRQYLDAFNNWDGLVNELAAIWGRDRAVGEPVLPAPILAVTGNSEAQHPNIVLYVRNRALSVAHVIAVPVESTGQDLESLVRAALALPGIEKKFGGAVGMRFRYRLRNDDKTIPFDKALVELYIIDGATIELEVEVESFDSSGSSPIVTYRQGASTDLLRTLSPELERHRHRQVRIDSLGQHEHDDPTKSWPQLAPRRTGRVAAAGSVAVVDLRGCGTLVLGPVSPGWLSAPDETNEPVSQAAGWARPEMPVGEYLAPMLDDRR